MEWPGPSREEWKGEGQGYKSEQHNCRSTKYLVMGMGGGLHAN